MRIGIAGFGKMGKMIRQKALDCGYDVPVVIDPHSAEGAVTHRKLTAACFPLDVIIDFTTPAAVVDNIGIYSHFRIPAVIGTTGWYDRMDEVAAIVAESRTGLIWSGNFSLGVNLFLRLVKQASLLMNGFPQYDPAIHEWHHRQKVDSPSGTAEMIGSIIIEHLDRKGNIITQAPQRQLEEDELHISSVRCGAFPGTHRLVFDSEVDSIVLEHTARNRSGFVDGAILAAEWIVGKVGLYNIDDLLNTLIGGDSD